MRLKKRQWIFLCVPLLFFAVLSFHRPLICFVLKQVLTRQMTYLKPAQFSYGHLGYNEGSIYLDNICVFHPQLNRELLHIDTLEFHFAFDREAKRFHTSYKVIKPAITWDQSSVQSSWKNFDLYKVLSLPQFVKKLTLEQGAIECITPQGNLLVQLSFVPGVENAHMGSIDLCLDQEGSRHLTMDLYKNTKDLSVHMKVREMPLHVLNSFFVSPTSYVRMEQGLLDGEVQLRITAERKLHSLKSDLSITELTLVDQPDSSFLQFNECRLRAMLPLDHQNKIDLTHLSLPVLMRYLVSTCEFEGGTICFNNPQTHSIWHLSDLEAMFTCNLAHTPSLSVKGRLEKDSALYPFALQGEGVIESEHNWWMDLALHRFCLEGNKTEATPIPLYIALLDGKEHFIKASVQNLEAPALRMVQDLARIWVPSLDQFELFSGSITTDLIVRIQDQNIHTVTLESLACSSLEGEWKHQALKVLCKEIQGKMKLHFPLFKNSKAPSWEIAYQGLKLEHNKTQITLESSGAISSKDWKIASSWIKTQCQGIQGEWSLSGPYSDLELSGSCILEKHHLASHFQDEVCAVSEHLQSLRQIECSLKIKHDQQQLNILGMTHLKYTGALIDKIRFGIELFMDPTKREICLQEGWFQSDELSEHTYLWLVKYYKQRWCALGKMKVTGEFDQEKIHFALESHEAFYESEDIIVKMGLQEGFYTGDFQFDLKTKSWLIHLPVVSAECIDKRFKLPFKEVKAEVTIEGMHLAAENIQAVCEEVDFQGRLDLDFTDPEWIDLKLYPNKISGDVQDFLRFMRYLPDFAQIHLPLTGKVEGAPDNYLFTQYNVTDSVKTSKLAFHISQGTYPINSTSSVQEVAFGLLWDSSSSCLEIKDLGGNVVLQKEGEEKCYRLNAQNLIAHNITEGEWEFDLRLEAPTFDVLRLAGSTKKEQGDYVVTLQPHLTHCFGAKLECPTFLVTPDFKIKTLVLNADLPLTTLLSQLQFAYLASILDVQPSVFQEIKSLKTEGQLAVKLDYQLVQNQMLIELKSDHLAVDQLKIDDLMLCAIQKENTWVLKHFKTRDLLIKAEAQKSAKQWLIEQLQIEWKKSSLAIKKGIYQAGCFDVELDHITAHLEDLHTTSSDFCNKFLKGIIHAQGRAFINVSAGLKKTTLLTELTLHSEAVGDGALQIDSQTPFKASYTDEEGLQIEKLSLHVHKKDLNEAWGSAEARYIQVDLQDHTWMGKGIKMTLPPEMLRYLAQLGLIPQVGIQGQHFTFFKTTFAWDNQIETEFDCAYDAHGVQIHGTAKDGYYWIGEKSVYFQNICYFFNQDQVNLIFGWDYQNISLDFFTKIQLKEGLETSKEGMEAKVTIKEGHARDQDERPSLDVVCRYSQDEGFYCQSIEGILYGVEFSFRRNPRAYRPTEIILTGQMKVDTSGLVKAFPTLFYQAVKDLGMGSGYELSGDWVFSKTAFSSSYFKGFLKGRDFEFLGFYFKTLLSEVEINSRGVAIHDFRLSDLSGVAQIKEAEVCKSEEDGSWKLHIPEITVQDFRPSFLKKNDGTEERIKPFVIKDLHFCDIEGTLGYKDSFSGRGHLDFINTFKRETNLLDIPIEIIGRIGFDLGLLVPVIGKIEFEMTEGKIFLRELHNTYSEGKRSKFYLSGYKDSYIGLDGTLRIDIKMKQYVLLKITQPFTLSIRGTLIKPKYSLR